MIEISAKDGDSRSIVISYGPMPEGSDALMEAAGTYEDIDDLLDLIEQNISFTD